MSYLPMIHAILSQKFNFIDIFTNSKAGLVESVPVGNHFH